MEADIVGASRAVSGYKIESVIEESEALHFWKRPSVFL